MLQLLQIEMTIRYIYHEFQHLDEILQVYFLSDLMMQAPLV